MTTAVETFVESRRVLIGQEIGLSDWIVIDQSKIDLFADATDDHQFIHVDDIRAKAETPFGGTIAHGFLSLSLCSQFAANALPSGPSTQKMTLNYGLDKVRFLNPVCRGECLRARFVLRDISLRKENQALQTYDLTVEIKGKTTPALAAIWLTLALF